MAGNGPTPTNPLYASDELVFIRCRADYATLTHASEQLAAGTDGVFTSGFQWTMTSASVDFMGQGVAPQCIIQLTRGTPTGSFPGSAGRFFAVDSVSTGTVNLRVVGQPLNVGQPPAPSTGLTGVNFVINTFSSLIEDASWDLKDKYTINEAVPFRASDWIYQGLEDKYRALRAACVLQVLVKAYSSDTRTKDGDFNQKLSMFQREYKEVLERVQLLWGPSGNSQPPTNPFACRLSR